MNVCTGKQSIVPSPDARSLAECQEVFSWHFVLCTTSTGWCVESQR